jgi:Tfp pilus assembly protein PilN
MRPVNLIPPEQRHGQQAPLRSGPLAYIVVGALALALAAVAALVLTNNQIADRESEVARLTQEDAAAAARATRLAAYTQFRILGEQRVATVQSLADSRFDWERVMRELALILPSDVWLTDLSAAASGGESEGSDSGLSGASAGPSLQMSGCAKGQEGVAGFVTALKDIDGVTRVGLQSSQLSGAEGGGEAGSEGGCSGEATASFAITAVFDAAPLPSTATEAAAPPVAEETTAAEGSEEG